MAPNIDFQKHLDSEAQALRNESSCADNTSLWQPLLQSDPLVLQDGLHMDDMQVVEKRIMAETRVVEASLCLTARIFPNAIYTPGLKHAMDNLLSDVWAAMSGKQKFFKHLHALEPRYVSVGVPFDLHFAFGIHNVSST